MKSKRINTKKTSHGSSIVNPIPKVLGSHASVLHLTTNMISPRKLCADVVDKEVIARFPWTMRTHLTEISLDPPDTSHRGFPGSCGHTSQKFPSTLRTHLTEVSLDPADTPHRRFPGSCGHTSDRASRTRSYRPDSRSRDAVTPNSAQTSQGRSQGGVGGGATPSGGTQTLKKNPAKRSPFIHPAQKQALKLVKVSTHFPQCRRSY